ncbi:unnamed protein product, partial [marine sediment metagenome]
PITALIYDAWFIRASVAGLTIVLTIKPGNKLKKIIITVRIPMPISIDFGASFTFLY